MLSCVSVAGSFLLLSSARREAVSQNRDFYVIDFVKSFLSWLSVFGPSLEKPFLVQVINYLMFSFTISVALFFIFTASFQLESAFI